MTIRRQYQLPNCSLVLDGLSIDPTPGNEEVMSLLVNAECRISGLSRSLNGGYNFFAALVRAVSQYGQEVLSGYAHPQVSEGEPLLVHINPGDGPYHHLVVQPEIADLGDAGDGRAIDIKLSSVQLFDLTEAVDQFFDDTQTLPELEQGLSPLARRFVRSEEPLSDRALPAVLGIGSLVAATIAIGLLSIPEIRDPAIDARRPEQSEEVAASGDSDTDDDERVDPLVTEETEAVDETSEEAASEPVGEAVSESVEESVDEVAEVAEVAETAADAAADTTEPIAETVTAAASATAGAITFDNSPPDATQSFSEVEALNWQLKRTIVDNREQPRFGDAISYRVRVDEDGNILGYQPENSQSESSIDETPLPGLVEAASSEEAVDYRVVFTERGVVEVSPWWGWSYYN